MSEENVEIVRRIYADFVDRPEALLELWAADFEMDAGDTAPDVGVVRGIDAVDAVMRIYFDDFEDFRLEIDEVIHADDRLVVVAMYDSGRMRGSHAESGTSGSTSGACATARSCGSRRTSIESVPLRQPGSPSGPRDRSPISGSRQDTAFHSRTAAP